MKFDDIARALGLQYKITTTGNYVLNCPFAPWTHTGGKDENPSFTALDVNDGFIFNCFACGVRGNHFRFYELAQKYNFASQIYDLFKDRFWDIKIDDFDPFKHYKRFKFKKTEGEAVKTDYEKIKDKLLIYHSYLKQRGIDEKIAFAFLLGYDDEKKGIIIPVYDINLNPVAYSLRLINENNPSLKYLHEKYYKVSEYWYAEFLLNPLVQAFYWKKEPPMENDNRGKLYVDFISDKIDHYLDYSVLFIVEGFFDAMKIFSFNFPAIAFSGVPTVTYRRISVLNEYIKNFNYFIGNSGKILYPRIIALTDGDEAGKKYVEHFQKNLKPHVYNLVCLYCPKGMDPGDFKDKNEFIEFLKSNKIYL